jgi:hypothetical protein
MRPGPGQAAASGRHPSGDNDAGVTFQRDMPQMTFVLADEAALDSSPQEQARPLPLRARSTHKSTLDDLPGSGTGSSESSISPIAPMVAGKDTGSRRNSSSGRQNDMRSDEESISRPATPAERVSTPSLPAFSQPMTPILLSQSGPTSTSSFASSRRGSFAASSSGDVTSQVPPGRDLAGQAPTGDGPAVSMMDSGSAPQLVMPSIKMPSRRPFTVEGKGIGRLKLLVAGESGGYPFVQRLGTYAYCTLILMLLSRRRQDISYQGNRTVLRTHRSRRPNHAVFACSVGSEKQG